MRPTERFSSRVEDYVRSRPSYPRAAIDLLATRCALSPAAVVADIGSGTGILTELLLESGARVIGVEPNDAMRAAAEARLGAQARFRSVNGTAEATTLPPASIDLLVAGQAFHWFDVDKARREALRLLRSAGFAALLWNERPPEATAFLADYEALLLRHAAEYGEITASRQRYRAERHRNGCGTVNSSRYLKHACEPSPHSEREHNAMEPARFGEPVSLNRV